MADFGDLGAALAGPDRALSYAKGLQYGANTQAALALARERVSKNNARETLMSSLQSLVPNENDRRGMVALIQSEVDPTQVMNTRLKQQELGFRDQIADPTLDLDLAQRKLLALAPGPVKPFESAGEGMIQNIFDSKSGAKPTALGDALIDQRTQAARLDEEKRLHPERFQTFNPFVVTPAGVFTKTPPTAPGAPPSLAPTVGPDGKPINYAQGVADVAGARTGATTAAKLRATAREALPGRINDIDVFRTGVNKLISMPGFDSIYGNVQGLSPVAATTRVLSQEAADANAARQQLSSQGFTVSIQKMRGLGALSNAEGLKVESAFTRATDPTISEPEAKIAWGEVLVALDNLERVAREEAGDAAVDGVMGVNTLPSFENEEQAAAAGIAPGTRVMIGGVKGTWQ